MATTSLKSFLREARRRRVFRVAAIYIVGAWVVLQAADLAFPGLGIEESAILYIWIGAILGLPIALFFGWRYDIIGGRIVRTSTGGADVDLSITRTDYGILAALSVVVAAVAFGLVGEISKTRVPEEARSTVTDINPRSIAVLPFDNLSADPENAFFADGIHDDLLTQLAKIGSLMIISRTSVLEYRQSPKNMRQIGQELGVATILEGSVRRAGDTVRINVQLIDAKTDENLWAESFDQELTAENIFAIQLDMANAIVEELRAALSPEEAARLAEVPTKNTRALNFYMSGNDYVARLYLPNRQGRKLLEIAQQQFERAVEEDPDFALAWAALGFVKAQLYGSDRTESRRIGALSTIERALSIAPGLPQAHFALGTYHYINREYEQALQESTFAEQGMPGDSRIYELRAAALMQLSDFEQAEAALVRAIDLDPRNLELIYDLAYTYGFRRNYAGQTRMFDRILEIAPDYARAYRDRMMTPLIRDGDVQLIKAAAERPPIDLGVHRDYLGWQAALYERDYEKVVSYLEDWDVETYMRSPKSSYLGLAYQLVGRPEAAALQFSAAFAYVNAELAQVPETEEPDLLVALGEVLVGMGRHEEAVRAASRALEIMPPTRSAFRGSIIRYEAIIRVFAPAGANDTAIAELDAYLSSPGHWSIEGMLPDPRLDPIRDDPRFQALVKKYKRD